MFRLDLDRRLLNSLALLALAIVILLLAQTGRLEWIIGIATSPIAPVQSWISNQFGIVTDLTRDPASVEELETENASLRARISQLESEVLRLRDIEAERDRLAAILNYARANPQPQYLPADVIGRDSNPLLNFIILNRGSAQGIFRDMPVVSADGLVGIVTEVTPNYCKVLLITDPSMAVNVRLQESRAEGVIQGFGTNILQLQFVGQDINLAENELVITSGLGGTYPPNIPVGTVSSTEGLTFDLFRRTDVPPRVNFDQPETLLIITNFTPPNLGPLLDDIP